MPTRNRTEQNKFEKSEEIEEIEVEEEPILEPETTMPIQDIMALIESKVADQIGEIETEKEEPVTFDDLKTAIAEQEPLVIQEAGIDKAEIDAELEGLANKLKEEARGEFAKVQTALVKSEEAVDTLAKTGLSKIAEAEKATAEKARVEVQKAKDEGKAYLEYRIALVKEELKVEVMALFDARLKKLESK